MFRSIADQDLFKTFFGSDGGMMITSNDLVLLENQHCPKACPTQQFRLSDRTECRQTDDLLAFQVGFQLFIDLNFPLQRLKGESSIDEDPIRTLKMEIPSIIVQHTTGEFMSRMFHLQRHRVLLVLVNSRGADENGGIYIEGSLRKMTRRG